MTSTPPDGGDMERRVSFLEKSFEKIDAKLDRLIDSVHGMDVGLGRVEELLGTKASAAEVAEIRGIVRALPTTWQMITLVFGILAGAFAIVRFGLPHP